MKAQQERIASYLPLLALHTAFTIRLYIYTLNQFNLKLGCVHIIKRIHTLSVGEQKGVIIIQWPSLKIKSGLKIEKRVSLPFQVWVPLKSQAIPVFSTCSNVH